MRKNINSKVEREIAEVLGHSSHKDMSVDEVLAMMLQVFLPVLMVFIISYFLFKTEVSKEIKRTQEVYKNPIVDNQRQTLMNALDKLENSERKKLGLVLFSHTNDDGTEVLDTTGLIFNGALVDNELVKKTFINGCLYAKKNIPFPELMSKRWFDKVIHVSRVSMIQEDYKLMNDPKFLVDENKVIIIADIENRIQRLSSDTRRLQSMAVMELQNYYINNTDDLDDNEIEDVIRRISEAKDKNDRFRLTELLQKVLKEHAYKIFKSQGVELLNNIN